MNQPSSRAQGVIQLKQQVQHVLKTEPVGVWGLYCRQYLDLAAHLPIDYRPGDVCSAMDTLHFLFCFPREQRGLGMPRSRDTLLDPSIWVENIWKDAFPVEESPKDFPGKPPRNPKQYFWVYIQVRDVDGELGPTLRMPYVDFMENSRWAQESPVDPEDWSKSWDAWCYRGFTYGEGYKKYEVCSLSPAPRLARTRDSYRLGAPAAGGDVQRRGCCQAV